MKINLEVTSSLIPGHSLMQVQAMLQHALDHDGNLPIGEHIYLKLKAGQLPLEQGLAKGVDTAAAILAYTDNLIFDKHEIPESHAEDGRVLLGYLQFLAQPSLSRFACEILVHPHFRQFGIGRKLWDKAVDLAQAAEIRQLDMWSYHHKPDAPSSNLAHAIGAHPIRMLDNMRRPANLPMPTFSLPNDLRMRGFQRGKDDAEWLTLNQLIFATHPENGSWTADDLELRFKQEWFHPDDFLILEDMQGKMIGFHWTKITPVQYNDLYTSPAYPHSARFAPSTPTLVKPATLGEIYIVGLHPAMHGHGLGRTLTLIGMQHLIERGSNILTLYVDEDNYVAVKLYKALGFSIHHQDVCFRLNIAP